MKRNERRTCYVMYPKGRLRCVQDLKFNLAFLIAVSKVVFKLKHGLLMQYYGDRDINNEVRRGEYAGDI